MRHVVPQRSAARPESGDQDVVEKADISPANGPLIDRIGTRRQSRLLEPVQHQAAIEARVEEHAHRTVKVLLLGRLT